MKPVFHATHAHIRAHTPNIPPVPPEVPPGIDEPEFPDTPTPPVQDPPPQPQPIIGRLH